MADQNLEMNAINHLLEVEKNASALINEAKIEAEKRVAEVRSKYNSDYKSKYEVIASEMEAAYQTKLEAVSAKYKQEIEDFKKSLTEKNQNEEAFNDLLEKYLLA